MPHLKKLSVGSIDLNMMKQWQSGFRQRHGAIWHTTRSWPKSRDEILDNQGCIYWIIKGFFSARQPIIGFEEAPVDPTLELNADHKPYCRIMLSPTLIPVFAWPHRPFQGWRYLHEEDTPPDANNAQDAEDYQLLKELEQLGIGFKNI